MSYPAGPILLSDPANRAHPLNQGKAAWWLALPGLDGGRRWFDLMGSNHGVLTNMGGGSGWAATTRPGGLGEIRCDGSDDFVDCGSLAGLNGATKAAYACWVYKSSNATTAGLGGSAQSTSNRFSFNWFTDGNAYFAAENSVGPIYAYCPVAIGWQRIFVVFDGTAVGNSGRLRVFVGGVEQSLTFAGTIPSALGNVSPFTIGKDSSDRFCGGSYDDVSLWLGNAPATSNPAAFAALDFDQSRRGHPNAINRVRPTAFMVSAPHAAAPVGSLILPAYKASGAATSLNPANGAISLRKVSIAGAATSLNPATGTLAIGKPQASGVATSSNPASGTLTLRKPLVSGTATSSNPAIGALALRRVVIAGTIAGPISATGSIHIRRPIISGHVAPQLPIVGSLVLRRPRVSGNALPPTLYAAIKLRFDTWPGLAESFPGGFRQDRMKTGTTQPNLVYNVITSASKRNMGRGYFDVIDLRFICYGDNSEQAEALGKKVKAAYFSPAPPLAFSDGYLMSFLGTGDLGPIENPASSGNKQFWSKAVQVRAKVGRNGP